MSSPPTDPGLHANPLRPRRRYVIMISQFVCLMKCESDINEDHNVSNYSICNSIDCGFDCRDRGSCPVRLCARYGGYGWGGWGSTPGSSMARGLGMMSMGRGMFNVDTAQARSINTNTA